MPPVAAEPAIICMPGKDPGRQVPDDTAVEVFRVSIGEIFVVTRPNEASCSQQPGNDVKAWTGAAPSLGNREYLGLVADQLNRLNNSAVPVADISRLWRAIFWAQDGRA